MKRWQKDKAVMKRQSKIWVESLHRTDDFTGEFDKPLGKFRKRRPCGCGHAQCRLCHSCKIDGITPHKVAIHDISVKEQLAEL